MADLEILLIKQLTSNFENVQKVALTSDLKLLSIHDKNNLLLISSLKASSNVLSLANIKSFAWQEDNYYLNEYRLLVIDIHNEIYYYTIKVKSSQSQIVHLEGKNLSKWNLRETLQQFHQLARQLEDVSTYEILKFEAKEAVFLFDEKIVVSFFPSASDDPQIMSISDLSDGEVSHQKVILMKEMLFALDANGNKFYIYSFSTNTKIYEIELTNCNFKYKDDTIVQNFSINLKLDLMVFVTKKQRIYSMSLNVSHINNNANAPVTSTVTAFTKQYPSVRRLNDSLRRYSISSGLIQPICLSCDTSDLILKELFILEDKLFVLFQGDNQSLVGIHILNKDEPTVYTVLPYQVFFIYAAPEEMTCPLLLFFDNKISLLTYDIEQDKLINELMIYPSSGAVETLASLNNWNSIQMDIEVLRLGLSNRKIYTVEFYLKTLFEGFCQQWNAPSTSRWFQKVQKECGNWENILNLVLENVHQNLLESITYQYAEQLLQIEISMVIQILDVIHEKPVDETYFPKAEKNAILSKFSQLLVQMRKLLREQEIPPVESTDINSQSISSLHLNSEVSDYWKKWENVLPEDIIQEAILTGTIPLAQSYFHCCCNDDTKVSFQQFETAAENLVLYFLRQGLMSQALLILQNMGVDISAKLLEIFNSIPERDIRILLQNELQERNLLSDSDMKLLKFVSLLEKLYPCTSFEHARVLVDEKNAVLVNEMNCAAPYSEEKLTVGDFMAFNQDNSESGAYCRIVLNWLTTWDDDIKSRILAPHFLKNSPVLDFYSKEVTNIEINPVSVWYYLLENGSLPYLSNWIDTWLQSGGKSDSSSIFKDWDISEDMINAIPERATLYISEILLNKLSKNGIFCEEELEDISLFLTRIGKSQCDVNDMNVFSSKEASITFSDLMHRLVHYCLKHQLVHFLYSLLSENYMKFSVWPACSLCDVPLLNLTKSFYLWSIKHSDSQVAYDAVARLAQYKYRLKSISPAELLQYLPMPLCLSIFLFNSISLTETINEALESTDISEQYLKDKFLPYPLLYNVLFKSSERSLTDVSVYELLKDSTVFDTTQLFGWQSTNTLKSEDSFNEFPHFSLKSLSEQYGLKKELNYLYFLKQGRPNYSYLKFIQQEVVLETGLSVSRIKSACSDVTDFALANYRNFEISLACVLFIELAGQDSLPLRASLIAANILHENMSLDNEQEYNKSLNEIWKLFKFAYLSKESASKLILELEKITIKSWDPYRVESDSLVKDISLWMPVMTLSHLFRVEAGNVYLIECAKQNKWLKFLVFSQIFQLPKEQVLKAAAKFSNSCIYYHIFHALHKKHFLQDVSQETKNSPPVKTPTKDMRKSLYSRIGVVKGMPAIDPKKAGNHDDDSLSISSEETCSSSETDMKPFVLKDLFSQLLLAHSSDCPWDSLLSTSFEIENPVLAILAASYPESPLQSCFYTWLYTTLCHDESTKRQLEVTNLPKRMTSVSTDDVEHIIILAIRNKKILIMWQAVHFFLQTTPLMPLMEFLKDFLMYKKFESSLEKFQNAIWDYPRNVEHPSVLHSALWIENMSVSVLKESVITCSANYERVILLRHYSHTRIEKSFSKEVSVPPFMKVNQMLQYTSDIGQDVDVQKLFLPEEDPCYQNACWTIVKKLLQLHLFHNAEMFATVARLPTEDLFLLQMKMTVDEARENMNWSKLSQRISFWQPILDKLNRTVVPVQAAVEFLENQCEVSDMFGEKYFLMKFLISLLSEASLAPNLSESKVYDIRALQKKMWWWCIKAEVAKELLPEIFDVDSVNEFDFQEISFSVPDNSCIIEDKERDALGNIINQFLFNKNLKKAFELASTFGYKSHDLEIIYTCLQLAREELDVHEVNIDSPDFSTEVPSSRFIRLLMLWLSSSSIGVLSAKKDIIMVIEKLGRKTESGISICHQILVHYIVATVLKRSYIDIVKEKDTLSILKQILTKKLNDDHVVAKCFITVRDLPDRDVAVFLSEEIWHSLQVLSIFDLVLLPEEQQAFSEELIYDPLQTNESFQLIVKLCQDPSMLGRILMDILAKETGELSAKSSDKTFSSAVELCICAHECFTATCDMDGISQILHKSQHLVNYLEEAKKFSIMVRLLTGLGRYSEMVYVFDVLKTHDKLPLLLVKRMENAPNLRLALLDYLKRLPPSEADNYFYTLAKTFGMYREKAEILEMSVQKQLSQLCKKTLDIGMREDLENALQCLSEAAKSYCKADCLHQAQNCTHLAQLVALQICFLTTGIWIIGLDDSSVSRFIVEHHNFSQSFIVAEHYGKHQLWDQAIINNVVSKGNKEYLKYFQAQFGISATLIAEVVKRYQKLPHKSDSMVKNMKYLLNLCPNIKAKYCLALEIGFKDIASELLMGEGSSYLQDLIANNLIKPT